MAPEFDQAGEAYMNAIIDRIQYYVSGSMDALQNINMEMYCNRVGRSVCTTVLPHNLISCPCFAAVQGGLVALNPGRSMDCKMAAKARCAAGLAIFHCPCQPPCLGCLQCINRQSRAPKAPLALHAPA